MGFDVSRMERYTALLRLLRVFVRRDLREQYAGTALGAVWAIVQPLLLVGIYWWVFGVVWALKIPAFDRGGGEIPFVVFLLSALLPWLAFQDALNKGVTAILSRADVLRHGQFPVGVFPLARVLAAHLMFFILIAGYVLVARSNVMLAHPSLLCALALILALQLLFACGLATLLASLAVYIRDLPYLLSMVLMGVFFTAPVLYPMAQIPEALRGWLWLNPYTPFATGYHRILLEGAWPDGAVWGYATLLAAVACVLARAVFIRLRPGFADVV